MYNTTDTGKRRHAKEDRAALGNVDWIRIDTHALVFSLQLGKKKSLKTVSCVILSSMVFMVSFSALSVLFTTTVCVAQVAIIVRLLPLCGGNSRSSYRAATPHAPPPIRQCMGFFGRKNLLLMYSWQGLRHFACCQVALACWLDAFLSTVGCSGSFSPPPLHFYTPPP